MHGMRSYMGWSYIPEVDNTTATSDDNPFAGPKTVIPGKVSVKMPTEEWLCKKLGKLNLTLGEGYPSTDPKTDPSKVSTWCTDASKLNSSYSRIARYTGLSS